MKSRQCWRARRNTSRTKQPPKEQPFHLLVDIQAKLSEGQKVKAYARWAKHYNLKEMSKTLIFLQENKIGSIEEMQERMDASTARYHELGDSIKASEKRLAEIAVLKAHIINYAKTRPVYDAYRKDRIQQTLSGNAIARRSHCTRQRKQRLMKRLI